MSSTPFKAYNPGPLSCIEIFWTLYIWRRDKSVVYWFPHLLPFLLFRHLLYFSYYCFFFLILLFLSLLVSTSIVEGQCWGSNTTFRTYMSEVSLRDRMCLLPQEESACSARNGNGVVTAVMLCYVKVLGLDAKRRRCEKFSATSLIICTLYGATSY